jgi:hypothetical protein
MPRPQILFVLAFAVLGQIVGTRELAAQGAKAEPNAAVKIRQQCKQANESGIAYGRRLGAAVKNSDDAALQAAKVAYADLMLLLRRLSQESRELGFPDTPAGVALQRAHQAWLGVTIENCQSIGLEYLEIVQDVNATVEGRIERVKAAVSRQIEKEDPFVTRLNEALGQFEAGAAPK